MRFGFMLSAALLAAMPAFAGEACLDSADYTAKGGKLNQLDGARFYETIPMEVVLCGDGPCAGAIDVDGVVNAGGNLLDLAVTKNESTKRPEARAAAVLTWMKGMRYDPPLLDGNPVCVKTKWHFNFDNH